MKAMFQQRRRDFLTKCSKYLRYVLNDHFVLVLMVFIGFLSLQYRQLLLNFPGKIPANLLAAFSGQFVGVIFWGNRHLFGRGR